MAENEQTTQEIIEQSTVPLYEEKLAVLKDGRFEHVAIICHDSPDPDCFASAMAMKAIAESYGLSAGIYYGGDVGHTQNRVMVNVLNIMTTKLDSEEDEETTGTIANTLNSSYLVVVDTSNFGKENCKAINKFVKDKRQPDLVVDHHEQNPNIECSYIHESKGSCSTIFYQILKSHGIAINKTLATALYLGINTDTADLKAEGTTDEDSDTYQDLKSLIDLEKFLQILNYPKPLALVDLRRRAYADLEVTGNIAVGNVGVITPQQRSLIGELCEELLEVESIDTAVIMAVVDEGMKGDKWLVASFRSSVLAINTKDFMTSVFGKRNAGGRKGSGAAQITLDAIHKNALDQIRRDHGDNGKLSQYTGFLFQAYAAKIREEKENV